MNHEAAAARPLRRYKTSRNSSLLSLMSLKSLVTVGVGCQAAEIEG